VIGATGLDMARFAVESMLSGVRKAVTPDQHLWYRRTFEVPRRPNGGRILLHFGAVDREAAVSVNGKPVGEHRGGYDPFTHLNGQIVATLPGSTGGYTFVPLSDAAKKGLRAGTNTLAIHVHQDRGGQYIDAGIVDGR
jgi:beta-galactosidase/beta-glucuronidase